MAIVAMVRPAHIEALIVSQKETLISLENKGDSTNAPCLVE